MSDQEQTEWTMPEWMEGFRHLIQNCRAEDVEEFYNDHQTQVWSNAPRALICVAVKEQVDLLYRLHNLGVLDADQAAYEMGRRYRSEHEYMDTADIPFTNTGLRNMWKYGFRDRDQELLAES